MIDHIPEPLFITLGGCAWPPPPRADGKCPVCLQLPMVRRSYCGWCDAVSLDLAEEIKATTSKAEARKLAAAAETKAKNHLDRSHPVELSEKDIRRIWNGYIGMLGREAVGEEVTNRARIGREWLRSVGLEPDWSIELRKRPTGDDD